MDCNKLRRSQTFSEARRVLETARATPSQMKLAEIAFANPSSRDILLDTIIREQEGAIKPTDDKTPGEKDTEKKLKEEQITGANDSEGSSDSTMPYPEEGKDGQVTDLKGASGEDQMKEGFGGPPPPQGGGQGGGMGAPGGMCPEVAQQMQPQMPQMPQMNTPQMMKQMHYTVTEALRPMLKKVIRLEEAIIAVDKKVQETSGTFSSKSTALVIPTGSPNTAMPQSVSIRETEYSLAEMKASATNQNRPSFDLDNKRSKIKQMDNYLSNTPYQ